MYSAVVTQSLSTCTMQFCHLKSVPMYNAVLSPEVSPHVKCSCHPKSVPMYNAVVTQSQSPCTMQLSPKVSPNVQCSCHPKSVPMYSAVVTQNQSQCTVQFCPSSPFPVYCKVLNVITHLPEDRPSNHDSFYIPKLCQSNSPHIQSDSLILTIFMSSGPVFAAAGLLCCVGMGPPSIYSTRAAASPTTVGRRCWNEIIPLHHIACGCRGVRHAPSWRTALSNRCCSPFFEGLAIRLLFILTLLSLT